MPNLTQAIEVLTCEVSEEKTAYRELSRAEERYQTNMGSKKILPRIAALEIAIQILKGHHQDTPTTDAQHTNIARDRRCQKCSARMSLLPNGVWVCPHCAPTPSAKGGE